MLIGILQYFLKHTLSHNSGHWFAHQQRNCVTTASAFCHSAAANGLYTAAACLCSTLHSLDKERNALYCMEGLKRERARDGARYCHVKHQYNNPLAETEV